MNCLSWGGLDKSIISNRYFDYPVNPNDFSRKFENGAGEISHRRGFG
jgi:hypothetical protein